MNEKRREKMEEQLAKKAKAIEEYASTIIVPNEKDVIIDGHKYQLVENYHEGFQPDKLRERFSPILTKFDYIVGDIGYDQLRLRGFYDDKRKVQPSQKISHLQDYLYEYCNFGCPYFVLKNFETFDSFPATPTRNKKKRRKNSRPRTRNRQGNNHQNKDNQKTKVQTVKSKNRRQGSRHFVIRKKKNNNRRDKNGK